MASELRWLCDGRRTPDAFYEEVERPGVVVVECLGLGSQEVDYQGYVAGEQNQAKRHAQLVALLAADGWPVNSRDKRRKTAIPGYANA